MTFEVPEVVTEVEGFTLDANTFGDNLAVTGRGDDLLEDGYIEIIIDSNGKNMLCPQTGKFCVCIVRLTKAMEVDFNSNDGINVFPLLPGQDLLRIELAEKQLYDKFGLWLSIGFASDGNTYSHNLLLFRYVVA